MKNEGNKYRGFDNYRPEIRKFDIENCLLKDTNEVLDIDKVLEGKKFTRDELLVAKLVLAEQAFLSGFDKIGENLLNSVIKAENKGKDVLFYIQCLQYNKKLMAQKAKNKNKYMLVKTKKVTK